MKGMVGRVGLGAITLVAVLFTASRASAQTITVSTTVTTVANNTTCTLPEAVEAINRQASYFGCNFTPTSATDRVVLNVPNVNPDVFVLDTPLTATRSMEIVGQGQSATTISSGGIWAVAAVDGAVLSVQDLILQKRPEQTLAVTGVRVEDGSTLDLDNVLVRNFNSTGIIVEGITEESFATIVDSTIENNTLGGINNTGGTIDIWNSAIRGNTTPDRGGGIHNTDGDSTITSIIEVYESVIENNTAQGDGGGVYSGSTGVNARVNLYRSLLRNNVSNTRGGGYFSQGQFILMNTTVTENWANTDGGGIFHQGAELTIQQCTIAGNGGTRNGVTTLLGGGVYANGGQTTLYRNIFANNVASFSPDVWSPNGGGSYNLIENASGAPNFVGAPEGTDLIGVDPALGTLRSMGGPTMVLPLLAGSPAIDRIPSNVQLSMSLEQTYPTDQRGSPRHKTLTPTPLARDGDSTGIGYDIGAFEQGIIETEFLTVAAKTSTVSHTILADSAYAKEQGARLNATANGHFVTYAIPVLSTGTYSFRIRARFGSNRGIYQVATANSLTGTYTNRGTPQDLYAASPTFNEVTLGGATVTFSTTGTKYIRFTVTGKNPLSSSHNLYLDWIQLVKQ